jgi:hypothetical protein
MLNPARRLRGLLLAAFAAAATAAAPGQAAAAAEPELYRIFLTDGAALVSYGEYARVADRVVFSMPIGVTGTGTNLQLVTIAESTVDWERTEHYTNAVRAKHYAATRGDDDFARLGNRVTEALNQITMTEDPVRRLAMAEEARTNLSRWPSQNYGYRAAEVASLVEMLDDVVSDLRVAAGQNGIELSLTANTLPLPPVPLLPPPDLRDNLQQALSAARHAADSVERVTLLRAIVAALKEPALKEQWAATLAARASDELATELRIDKAYADLRSRTIASPPARTGGVDVRGVEALTRSVLDMDDRLGRKRPQEVASLLAFLDARLEEARRLRLAQDAWAARRQLFSEYRRKIEPAVTQLRRSKAWLDDVRRLAGPAPGSLDRHEQRVVLARRAFELVTAPPELAPARDLYAAAFQMARRAAAARRNAVSSNDMKLAWDASSAAAGALMLIERADEELGRLTTVPIR